MKKYIPLLILVFLIGFGAKAQTFSDDNYIYTVTPKKPVQTAGLNALTKDEKNQSITYFDGLGRPVQTIAIGQGEGGKDIITPVEYDVFGRQVKEYLPYASQNGGDNYTRIDPAVAINALTGFYGTQTYDNTANPFSQKKLEASPLNRVLRQAAPGDAWAMDSGHEIKMDYQTNTADEVRLFTATATWDAGLGLFSTAFSDEGNYAANQLYKTITYDENTTANPSESSGSTVEFKNKEGQVILKRTYNSGDKHDTYYVYDRYGNLSYVLPPKVTGVVSNDVLNGLCYQYKYDHRNRLVEKKLPGKQWEYIVYDKLDRPVATGPAFSPFKDETAEGWLITKYDGFGRPVYTGWSGVPPGSANRKSLQDEQNTATVLYESRGYIGTIGDNITIYYSNNNAPVNFKLLTVTYYDDYDYPNAPVRPASVEDQAVLDNTKGLVTGSWTRALTTSSETLGETTTTFYDTKARAISTRIQNHLSGYTTTDSKLDFTGKVLYSITKHKRKSGDTELTVKEEFTYSPQDRLLTHTHQINGGTVEVLANNSYDDLGQLIVKNVGNNVTSPLQKVHYSYNIRGWLTGINNVEELQQDTDPKDLFAFKINYDKQPGNSQVQALYNGNISETTWKTNTDVTKRSYGYQYDNLNRLTSAIYSKPNDAIPASGAYNESLSYDKNGNITSLQRYGASDAPSIVFQIDDLTYGYLDQNSNQLTKVTDSPAGNDNEGFKDGNKTGDDFTYDANGNMITDKNKSITEIQYNQLNLPKKITFGTSGSIEYIYNAAGQKLEKIVSANETVTKTDYLDGFQYNYVDYGGPAPEDPGDTDPPIDGTDPVIDPPVENNRSSLAGEQNVVSRPTLQFFPTEGGYYDNVYQKYVYHYRDHLGNVRLSYDRNPVNNVLRIVEESNYYPFGLKHKGYNMDNLQPDYKYKFQGQERQDELSLNWDSFKYRNYDMTIGRFMSIDPLAENYSYQSPYNFAENKVISHRELEGLEGAWFQAVWNAHAYAKPNGVPAHVNGVASGLYNSAKGLVNAVTHPVSTVKGIANMAVAGAVGNNPLSMLRVDNAIGTNSFGTSQAVSKSIDKGVNNLINGNGQQRGEVIGEIAGAVIGAKGINATINSIQKASTMSTLTNSVNATAAELAASRQTPATVVGAELNGQTMITISGAPPSVIAPQLEGIVEKLGGIGTKTATGNTVGCCSEFHAGNSLLIDNPSALPNQINFTNAIRPRTGQIIDMCDNCKATFEKK